MKPFDKNFSESVKQAFGDYKADHLADAGWDAFVQKRNKSKGFLVLFPIWAKAASIAILLSLGSYIAFRALQPRVQREIVVENEIQKLSPPTPVTKPKEQTPIVKATKQSAAVESRVVDKLMVENRSNNQINSLDSVVEALISDTSRLPDVRKNMIADSEFSETHQQDYMGELDSISVNNEYVGTAYVLPQVEEPMALTRISRTKFVAGLSGMVAAIESLISDAPGLSVGLYAEHRLTDNIYIRPGMALAKHSYGMQSLSSGSNDLMYNALPSTSLNESVGESVLYNNHMDLVVMEIPINFVFKIRERQNSNVFVSAGASSLIYLSQKFSGTSRYSETLVDLSSGVYYLDSKTSDVEVSNEYSAFSRTDLFGLLNFSAGYTFPFTDKSTMSVEPFIQLPLGRLTSNEMRMGFGGVSLKIQIK